MKQCFTFENEEYEIFVENEVFVKDKCKKEFYKTSIINLDETLKEQLSVYKSKINSVNFTIYITLFLVLLVSNLYFIHFFGYTFPRFEHNLMNYSIFVSYMIFNVFIHELGHIKSMNFFGRKHNKVGFKMNFYVFPSFYVQLNDIYMLSKKEKLIVHSAGIYINLFIILTIQIINTLFLKMDMLSVSYIFFSLALLWNVIPVLNSDGYKILLTILNKDEFENSKKNHFIIKIIQIIGVLLAIRSVLLWF